MVDQRIELDQERYFIYVMNIVYWIYGICLINWIYDNMGCVLINSKVDGRKFNKPGVKKAEHEKVTLAQLLDLFVPPNFL